MVGGTRNTGFGNSGLYAKCNEFYLHPLLSSMSFWHPPVIIFWAAGSLSLSIIFFLSVLFLIYTVCRLHADGTMSASGSKDTLLIYYVHRSYIHQCPVLGSES